MNGKYGVGMQNLLEFITDNLQHHDAADALETTTCAAGTGSEEHASGQNNPGDMGPLGGIIIEETGRRDERNNLEDATTKRFLKVIAIVKHELSHDEKRECDDNKGVEAELFAFEHHF